MTYNLDTEGGQLRSILDALAGGTAGTPGGAVQSVQGVASGTPLAVAGSGVYATGNFSPAAAAYSAGDIMGASVQFSFLNSSTGLAVPTGSLIRILTTIVRIDVTALQASEGAYTLHGYSVTQPSAQADNDAWTLASADLASYRGSISLGTPVDLGAALYVKSSYIDLDIRLTSSSLWARLVTVAGFTATAVDRQVTLYGIVL